MSRDKPIFIGEIDGNPRPEFVPVHFYSIVEFHLSRLQTDYDYYKKRGHELTEEENDIIYFLSLTIDYLKNLVSSQELADFYIHVERPELEGECFSILYNILHLFLGLSNWELMKKTSGAVDDKHAEKIINYMNKIIEEANKSDDLCQIIQDQWEKELVHIVAGVSNKKCKSADDEVLLKDARSILFKEYIPEVAEHMQHEAMHNAEYVYEPPNFLSLIEDIKDGLEESRDDIRQKPSIVKKYNDEDASLTYVVRELKRIMKENSLSKHTHIRFISEIIFGVMKEDISRDQIITKLKSDTRQ